MIENQAVVCALLYDRPRANALLFLSGQESRRLERTLQEGGAVLLHKPFGAEELLEAAARALKELDSDGESEAGRSA